MFKKHKFKFLAALVIMLVAAGGGIYYFKKKSDEKKAKEAAQAVAEEIARAKAEEKEPLLAAVQPKEVKKVELNSSLSKSTPMKTAIKPLAPITTKK